LAKYLRKERIEILLGRDTAWVASGAKPDDARLQCFSKRTSRNTTDKAPMHGWARWLSQWLKMDDQIRAPANDY